MRQGELRIDEVDVAATYDLRRLVLRDAVADADVTFPEDELPGAFHLAALDGVGDVVGVSTWAPVPTGRRPGAQAWRLRGMATAPAVQGRGVGAAMLEAAVTRLRAAGVAVVWADGRDTALRFYQRHGWQVEGDGYVTGPGLPHHTVVLDLS